MPQAFLDLRRILAEREPFYEQADVTVDTSRHEVPTVVDELVGELAAS